MIDREKYFVRIDHQHQAGFEIHTSRNLIPRSLLSNDWGVKNATHFYSIEATTEELLALKLSVPLIGYTRAITTGRLIETHII